jgi:hypothetical protein
MSIKSYQTCPHISHKRESQRHQNNEKQPTHFRINTTHNIRISARNNTQIHSKTAHPDYKKKRASSEESEPISSKNAHYAPLEFYAKLPQVNGAK